MSWYYETGAALNTTYESGIHYRFSQNEGRQLRWITRKAKGLDGRCEERSDEAIWNMQPGLLCWTPKKSVSATKRHVGWIEGDNPIRLPNPMLPRNPTSSSVLLGFGRALSRYDEMGVALNSTYESGIHYRFSQNEGRQLRWITRKDKRLDWSLRGAQRRSNLESLA